MPSVRSVTRLITGLASRRQARVLVNRRSRSLQQALFKFLQPRTCGVVAPTRRARPFGPARGLPPPNVVLALRAARAVGEADATRPRPRIGRTGRTISFIGIYRLEFAKAGS